MKPWVWWLLGLGAVGGVAAFAWSRRASAQSQPGYWMIAFPQAAGGAAATTLPQGSTQADAVAAAHQLQVRNPGSGPANIYFGPDGTNMNTATLVTTVPR